MTEERETAPTPATAAALARSGWTANRSVDVTDLAERLEVAGVPVHDPWRSFMARFAELEMETRQAEEIDLRIDDFIGYETSLFASASRRIGLRLTPIGQYRDSLLLGMAPDGRVFGFHGEDWNFRTRLVGVDGIDALNRLIVDEEHREDDRAAAE